MNRLEIELFGSPSKPLIYVVKPGDWMAKIAKKHGVFLRELMVANPELGPPKRSYDKIYPGDKVKIPEISR